jgi:hypothetical protein
MFDHALAAIRQGSRGRSPYAGGLGGVPPDFSLKPERSSACLTAVRRQRCAAAPPSVACLPSPKSERGTEGRGEVLLVQKRRHTRQRLALDELERGAAARGDVRIAVVESRLLNQR